MTKNRFHFILFLISIHLGFAQSNLLWQGYFSYNDIRDLSQSSTAVFAASENALFSKEGSSNQIRTTNTVDGLSGQTITSLYYSSSTNKTIIGHENGLITVINEADNSMINVVDIIKKQLPSNIKKINHFMEYNGIVYVSCDFGIVQFNLQTMLFGDTYFIGRSGTEISVLQTAVFKDHIYAATIDGIKRALVSSTNLIDFNQWIQIAGGSWVSVEAFDKELMAINAAGTLNRFNSSSNSFNSFLQLPSTSTDLRSSNNSLIVTTSTTVFVYNSLLGLVKQINSSEIVESTVSFSCATIIGNVLYLGTKENGIYTTTAIGVSTFENAKPSGPIINNIFAIQTTSTSLWAVYGDYDLFYNPYPLDSYGVSKFSDKGWLNIPYKSVFGAKSLVRVIINPANENQIYASSFFSGLLKIEDDVPTILYNQSNSALESLKLVPPDPSYIDIRINGTAFDRSGNLWVTNSLLKNSLKKLTPAGQWQSYAIDKVLNSSSNTFYGRLTIDKNETKWLATDKDGLIGFNEKNNFLKKITVGADLGNLPSEDVRIAAVDNNNQLWIGTTKGLRVLSNLNSFQVDDQLTSRPIIILEDNLAQELLFEQFITDIVVDGANNKWISTADSGIFLVSPNGQETIYHFTINNSPLPSNTINDVDINTVTGEVFIATTKGMVSFKGVATKASEDLNNVFVYPNPVRPDYEGSVKISGLLNKANVKITDVQGNLVFETTAEGGTIEWDTTAFGKYKVSSGVYLIFVSAKDGIETKVKKVMIVR